MYVYYLYILKVYLVFLIYMTLNIYTNLEIICFLQSLIS